MDAVTIVIVVFSLLGALDRIFGNRLGLGKQFEKGFMLFGSMALSMIGMIALSPLIAEWCKPLFSFFSDTLHIDPSIIPAALFANDMGGAPLAKAVAIDSEIGMFNALIVSSMLGCTVSYTIPYALGMVNPKQHRELMLGLLCGIVTIPPGCFVSGVMLHLPMGALLKNLLPLVIFSALVALALSVSPSMCVKAFKLLGKGITVLITFGLALSILRFMTGIEVIKGLDTFENGANVCLYAAVFLTGAFPLIHIITKLLLQPMKKLGDKIGVNETSIVGLVASLASSTTTFEMFKDMDKKGILLNSAFSVSGAFTFAAHLAFTLAFDAAYLVPMIVGKLFAGFLSLLLSYFMSGRLLSAAQD